MNKTAGEDIDVHKLIRRQNAAAQRTQAQPALSFGNTTARYEHTKSSFADPLAVETNYYGGGVRTISHFYGRQLSYRILRRVSEF